MTASFGVLLRERRRAAGLTQRALAERAQLDFSYISKLENNRLPPPAADTIVLLCSILGTPADDLLAFTHKLPSAIEEKISANVAAQVFLRGAQDLTEGQWQHLAKQLPAHIDTRQKRMSMLPTRANAYDLVQWASRYDAPGQLPELVRRLILATAGDITHLQMRSDEGTHYGGYDGTVKAGRGNAFVPEGLSVWEMGVDPNPKKKADDDYTKRTAKPLDIDPSQATFVFVTPRRWPGKEQWAADKRKNGPWRDVRAFDADDLATWLPLAPEVHVWISRLVGKDPGNVRDLESFWLDWQEATRPPLSAELITAGQEKAAQQLIERLRVPASTVTIRADSQEEALAFVAAAFERLPKGERDALFTRTLIVYSADAWSQMVPSTAPLVLLPMFAPAEIVLATRGGHHVLIPVGRETAEADGMLVLQQPSLPTAEAALVAMGISQERASSLAAVAHRSLLSLRRQLAVNPALQQPAWATREQARSLLPALLAGSWDEALEGDQNTVAALAGRPYEEVAADLVGYTQISDPPVRRVGTTWLLASKEDAWRLLARFLTRQNLERFRQATNAVLATLDPALELPLEQRWQAAIRGHARPHSRFLREGLADTFALMGIRPVSDWPGGGGSARSYVNILVAHLLRQANDDPSGRVWISLADVLPLLAEAAPEVFLSALDIATTEPAPVIQHLFNDRSGNVFTARSNHPHLLWALERLAWSPLYLSHAALLLARLTRLNSEGHLANPPGTSLRKIFVPWCPQTTATFEEQLGVLDRLREQERAVAWKLMITLLPRPHDTVDPSAAPRWRDWKPEGQEASFTYAQVWRVTDALITRLLLDVGTDSERFRNLVECVQNLPPPLRVAVLDHLESLDPAAFDTSNREAICAELRQQIANHRRFSHAPWAMPREDVDRLRAIYERFKPENLLRQVLPLFTAVPHLLDEPDGSDITMDEEAANKMEVAAARQGKHEEAVYQAQVAAAQQVYQAEGLTGLLTLIEMVEQPGVLGWILGRSGLVEAEEDQILHGLDSPDPRRRRGAEYYVAGRFWACGWTWADKQLRADCPLQTPEQQAGFLLNLPRRAETWDRLERLGENVVDRYWRQYPALVEDPADCLRAARQLLIHERPERALDVVAHYVGQVQPDPEFVMSILEQARDTSLNTQIEQLYEIQQLLEYLEQAADGDADRLARIELGFLPLFRYEQRPFKALYHQLAADPQFFIELVCLAYRASDEAPRELSEDEQARAHIAYDLLHAASEVPGTQNGNLLDFEKLTAWVEEVRRVLDERKRREVGDLCIGHLLSHASSDGDEIWPPQAIRALLEHLHSEDVEQGIELAVHNARGATWRSLTDGGTQERKLAEQYHAQAQVLQIRWPRTADMLRRLAQSYEEEARMHDREAELRQHGW